MRFVLLLSSILLLLKNTQSKLTQHKWRNGRDTIFEIIFTVPLQTELNGDWWITLDFSNEVSDITTWNNRIDSVSAQGRQWTLKNPTWQKTHIGEFQLKFHATVMDQILNSYMQITACLLGNSQQSIFCETITGASSEPGSTSSTTTPSATTTTQSSSNSNEPLVAFADCDPQFAWQVGSLTAFKGKVFIDINQNTVGGWKMILGFSKPTSSLNVHSHADIQIEIDSSHYLLRNKGYTETMLVAQSPTFFEFEAKTVGDVPVCTANFISGTDVISSTTTTQSVTTTTTRQPTTTTSSQFTTTTAPPAPPPTTTTQSPVSTTTTSTSTTTQSPTTTTTQSSTTTTAPQTGGYDYAEVIHKSILFYEAQRSGPLPATNRIPWRGDSALNDGSDKGYDLTGGWYDAGDHVKFNFPMAGSVTMLAWGISSFWNGYLKAGELDNAIDSIKWPLDYFIKCHVEPNKLCAQVGNGHADHAYWGRAEDMTMSRPSFFIDRNNPGSDLAAEVATAMTVSSMVFMRYGDVTYAATLLQHAKELFDFAYTYKGKYSDSVPAAADFYRSYSGYQDELALSALWLYKVTDESHYLQKAEEFYPYDTPKFLSWDDKKAAAHLLFYSLDTPKKTQAQQQLEQFLDNWFYGNNGIHMTDKGLAWGDQWGSLRYSSNVAFLALLAREEGIRTTCGLRFAREQIGYALGDAGRSFVCGFGQNPPERPHHRGASCPNNNQPCDWDDYNSPNPNPNVLIGALVGGPDRNDYWIDDRKNYIFNEITTDYNAGFQSAVAGLLALQ